MTGLDPGAASAEQNSNSGAAREVIILILLFLPVSAMRPANLREKTHSRTWFWSRAVSSLPVWKPTSTFQRRPATLTRVFSGVGLRDQAR
jgi:hypothetical protein